MADIQIHDKIFTTYIDREAISNRVKTIAEQINKDYNGREVLILGILNGSFIFAADVFRCLGLNFGITFIRLVSYQGMSSGGSVYTAIGLKESLKDKHILIVEDIIDTGKTMHSFLPEIWLQEPASVKIASLLVKPDALQYDVQVQYTGFSIPNKFIVGYGLDYDGLGRNLPDLYILKEE